MKFSRLVRVHTWVSPIFFIFFFLETISPIEPVILGEMYPKTWFSGFHSASMGFRGKDFKAVFGTPFPKEKVIFIFVVRHPTPQKWSYSPKNFSLLFKKKIFFFNCYMKNIQNLISYKKVYIDFCHKTTISPQNGHVPPQMVLCIFFNIN